MRRGGSPRTSPRALPVGPTPLDDGIDRHAIVEERRTQRAAERSFEIVGKALSRFVRDFPAVAERIHEHRRVIHFRNELAHGYAVVDPRLVCGLARTRLPALLAALRAAR